MIWQRFAPSHRGQRPNDRGPAILKCDGCGAKATPSKALVRGWRSMLGIARGQWMVLDVCPTCADRALIGQADTPSAPDRPEV